jgi:hypothetical protein
MLPDNATLIFDYRDILSLVIVAKIGILQLVLVADYG